MRRVDALRKCSGTGSCTVLLDVSLDGPVGGVEGVRFGRGTKVDDRLRQREIAFGHAEEVDGVAGRQRDVERVGIGEADVLRRHADDATRDVESVFPGLEHASQPVERSVRIAVAHALVQRGDEVVVLFAGLVVHEDALLQGVCGDGFVDATVFFVFFLGERGGDFEGVVGAASVSAGVGCDFLERVFVGCEAECAKTALFVGQRTLQAGRRFASSVSALRMYTRLRESRAEMISKDGFSVVAPMRRMLPFST